MKSSTFLYFSILFIILTVSSANGYFMDDFEEEEVVEEEVGEERVFGALPDLDISNFLSLTMEPHNAMVQVF